MRTWFSKWFSRTDIALLLTRNPQIIDVRSPQEFRYGHVTGALNIPVQQLLTNLDQLDKNRPIITCCRSGVRSKIAAKQLNAMGFEAINGGTWQNVQKKQERSV